MYDKCVTAKHHKHTNKLILGERLLHDHGTAPVDLCWCCDVNFLCDVTSEKSARLWDDVTVRFFYPFVGSAQLWESI